MPGTRVGQLWIAETRWRRRLGRASNDTVQPSSTPKICPSHPPPMLHFLVSHLTSFRSGRRSSTSRRTLDISHSRVTHQSAGPERWIWDVAPTALYRLSSSTSHTTSRRKSPILQSPSRFRQASLVSQTSTALPYRQSMKL